MNKTKIEWVRNPDSTSIPERDTKGRFQYQGYTWNPITGCLNHVNGLCKGGNFPCYAYKLANGRLKQRYLANQNIAFPDNLVVRNSMYEDPFYPRFWEERLIKADKILKGSKKPLGIFPVDMGDWCGIGIPESWSEWVLELARRYPQHRFYLLTKQPQNLPKWSPFPENCWVGVTAVNHKATEKALHYLFDIEAKVKFISFEPLLDKLDIWAKSDFVGVGLPCEWERIDWLILGACTGSWVDMAKLCLRYGQLTLMPWRKRWTAQPPIEWLQEIVEAADKAGIRVFLKGNLTPLFAPEYEVENPWAFKWGDFRQEMPG